LTTTVLNNLLAARNVNPPLVSICIPTYNRPEYLRRAVESSLAQTYPQFEIVITDNSAHPDGSINRQSAELAAKWTDPRIRYHNNGGNIGPHASAIKSKNLARGKYIKFLMDDDLLKPRCLELMVKSLEENPTAAIAMAPMDLIDENDRRIFPRFYVFRQMHYRYRYQVGDGLIARRRILKDFLTRDYPCTVPSGILFRTEALRRAGEFSYKYQFAGDLEMCMRLAAEWDFYYIDQVLSSWRFMPSCHTASLHQTGLQISDFYTITRASLANESVQKMFGDEWKKIVPDSMFFCSCRALLNGLAGLRSRNPKLIFSTIKTILHEDSYISNWFRLPLFVFRQILVSVFPHHDPPPRE
jgi:glycosyltransferase involved in cell wall biosynthesis